MNSTYRAAGVDIKAGEETVDKIKDLVKATHNKNVLTGIGHFGSFFELDTEKYKRPVMVSSVDGVGTKLKIAFVMDKHDTVGQDLVNHCVNDIAVCGADPLYFMDYLAFGKLIPTKAEAIIAGFAKACSENGVALVGGETAEMPGLYDENEYDMSGTIVGVVEKDQIIDGSNVKEGDILIGFPSTGLHTNGYSLARKVLFEKFTVNQKFPEIESTLGDLLLAVHKSYLNEIRYLKSNYNIHGFSHITGGGIIGNTKRVVPNNLKIEMDWNSWELPFVFKLIMETGEIDIEEMRQVFNLGIGLIAITDPENADRITSDPKVNNSIQIGKIGK
ncbi:MAG: phosphoribosylformylglycinamidine cyclo-ligase [Melioribacteraceae bacterium]|nr:phosphoribosylformylglycinamidine cyclo-ligase [Melioribacteraceae bacterium]MCF8263270.1 phosphoribosylformylglycinamidine cyclo-ligase [Melioribacteraceae bacterium]MCF8430710.1 phosphoribosylformylglycinamidine cyclo-ligase [Melioribacteraceae bacterium]